MTLLPIASEAHIIALCPMLLEGGITVCPLHFDGYIFTFISSFPPYSKFYLGWLGGEGKGRALGVGEVKFTGQVLPTAKKVTYRIHFKRIVNRRLIMGLADGEVLVDGRLIYTASDLKVGLFQDTSAF